MIFVRQVHFVSALLLACASSAGTRYATAAAVIGTVKERAQSISELQASSEWYSNRAQTQVGFGDSVTRLPRNRRLQDATEDDAGAWDDLSQIPLERTLGEVSAGVLSFEGKSYMLVVGEAPIESNNTATLIYDFAEDTWLIGSSREFAGNHHASEVIDNKMYLFGGLTTGNHTIQIASLVQAPQGVDVQWSFGADLPVPSGSAATALIDGQVYYCGGIDAGNTFTYDTCYLYDPVSDTWAGENAVPAMPQGRNHAATCTDGEKMYIFGGRIGENVVGEGFNDTQIYTPGEGWSEGTPLPLARGGMGKAVYYEGECYVLGGEVEPSISPDPSVKISPTRTVYRVDVYSPVTDSWRLAEDMPQGLHGVFPILFEDAIYVAGGGTEAAYSQSTLHMRLSLGTETSSRGIGGDSSAAAPSPGSFRAAAPSAVAPDKSSAAAPASSSINLDSAPDTVSRSSAVSITGLEPLAWKSTLQAVLRSAPVTEGAKQYVLSAVRAVSLCAQLPWVASVLTSLLAYNMLQPDI